MKALLSLGLCVLLASASCATTSQVAGQKEQAATLKHWALCKCLAMAFPDTPAGDDAAKTAAAYLEFGTAPIESYEDLKILAGDYLKRTYSGSVPSSYNTRKCIDLYESSELEQLAGKISSQ